MGFLSLDTKTRALLPTLHFTHNSSSFSPEIPTFHTHTTLTYTQASQSIYVDNPRPASEEQRATASGGRRRRRRGRRGQLGTPGGFPGTGSQPGKLPPTVKLRQVLPGLSTLRGAAAAWQTPLVGENSKWDATKKMHASQAAARS